MSVFHEDWSDSGIEGLKRDFQIENDSLEGVKILFAAYTQQDYDGEAFVLFEKDGDLYEVNGGHCSCYGLEGQWEPEYTSISEIRGRTHQRYNFCGYKEKLVAVLDILES